MRRREVLFGGLAAGALGVAGCSSSGGKSGLGSAVPATRDVRPARSVAELYGAKGAGDAVGDSATRGFYIPPNGLPRWRSSSRPVRNIALVGDSIVQSSAGNVAGFSVWFRRELENLFGPSRISAGFYGVWRGQPMLGRDNDWAFVGPWQLAGGGPLNATPYNGQTVVRSVAGGAANTATLTVPEGVICTELDVDFVDAASGGAAGMSISVDEGATWRDIPTQRPKSPKVVRHLVQGIDPSMKTIRIRAADAAGTPSAIAALHGVELRTGNEGWTLHNMGSDGAALSPKHLASATAVPIANSTGNWHALLDAIAPELIISLWSNDAANDHFDEKIMKRSVEEYVSKVEGYADLLFLGSPFQGGSGIVARSVANQEAVAEIWAHKAKTGGHAMIDYGVRWGTAAVNSAAGLLQADHLHPSEKGGRDMAADVGRMLRLT